LDKPTLTTNHVLDNLMQISFDKLVKSQKAYFLLFRRKPESSHFNNFWTPAFAGVTELGLFTKLSLLFIRCFRILESVEQLQTIILIKNRGYNIHD